MIEPVYFFSCTSSSTDVRASEPGRKVPKDFVGKSEGIQQTAHACAAYESPPFQQRGGEDNTKRT